MALTRLRRLVLALGFVIVASPPGVAQTRLYLLTGGDAAKCTATTSCAPGRLADIDVDVGRVTLTSITHARFWHFGPQVTPDGRYVLWSGAEGVETRSLALSLYDVASRQQFKPFRADQALGYAAFALHPAAMRAWFQTGRGQPVTLIEPERTQAHPALPCADPVFKTRSGDGRRLSYFCDQPRRILIVDSDDGHVIATVPLGPSAYTIPATAPVLNHDGTTLYVADSDDAYEGDPVRYRRFDVATGTVMAEALGATNVIFAWELDERNNRLYAGSWTGLHVLDADTLTLVGTVASPYPVAAPRLAFDPERPHLHVAWGHGISLPITLALVHTETLATLASKRVPVDGDVVGIALGPRPPQVSDLHGQLRNGVATLTWTRSGSTIATGQIVEVGFAPGQTMALLNVPADSTSLTVPDVPPGRYFVRVRSVNGTGIGAPSNEVIVE